MRMLQDACGLPKGVLLDPDIFMYFFFWAYTTIKFDLLYHVYHGSENVCYAKKHTHIKVTHTPSIPNYK
jgi:hypothetical protein